MSTGGEKMKNIAFDYLTPLQQAQLLHCRPDLRPIKVNCGFCGAEIETTHNENRCPACGKRGYISDLPMVRLAGTVK